MKVDIKQFALGWAWELTTSDGHFYSGIAFTWEAMLNRIWHLNGLVIEHNPNEFV